MRKSQLLILGNGFDLHCGLMSSYKDFFQDTLLDTCGEDFNWIRMKAGVAGFWESLLLEYYKKYRNINYNWCDIETIIKKTLLTICDNNDFVFHAIENVKRSDEPYGAFEETDDSIESFLCKSCMSFYRNIIFSSPNEFSEDELLSFLIDCLLKELHVLEKRFCKYLKNNIVCPDNEKKLNEQYLVNAINLLTTLTGFNNDLPYKSIHDIIVHPPKDCSEKPTSSMYQSFCQEKPMVSKGFADLSSVIILNFNYTALFDILKVKSPCVYNNVHGKLCTNRCAENCSDCNIIFGIDDSVIRAHDKYSKLYKFSKTYRKMLSSNDGTHILPAKNNQLIEIKFYGHSLNEADYSYFQSIFDYYNLYENTNVSLIFYYSKGFEQTDKVYQLINTYGKTLSNKDQGNNLTHKLLLENRLKIVEIP